jgi:hypothetical protein
MNRWFAKKHKKKGLSDYRSNETAGEAARWGAIGLSIKGYSHEISTQKEKLDNSCKPNQTRAKGSPPEKNTTSKKELLTLTLGNVAEGRCWSR